MELTFKIENNYSTTIDLSVYNQYGLCRGIDLRRHMVSDLEEQGPGRLTSPVRTIGETLSEVVWVRT